MALELSEEQLELLKELGATYFTFKECAIVLGVETSVFVNAMKSPGSVAYKTYYSAFYTSTLKVRKSIMDLAVRGSGPAQQQMIKIIDAAAAGNK
ncbi:MAG: hypothetical protein JWO03_2854 [Bacteroidetes bacterium]|nr:hypothetical protein [Bacteroidota bacterium]